VIIYNVSIRAHNSNVYISKDERQTAVECESRETPCLCTVCIMYIHAPFIRYLRPSAASGFDGRRRKGRQREFTSFLFLYYTHCSLKIWRVSYSLESQAPSHTTSLRRFRNTRQRTYARALGSSIRTHVRHTPPVPSSKGPGSCPTALLPRRPSR